MILLVVFIVLLVIILRAILSARALRKRAELALRESVVQHGLNHMPFLKGAATSGFQSECSVSTAPPSLWRRFARLTNNEGVSPNHIHLPTLRRDMKLLKDMGGNAYRFSIEWARVSPRRGQLNAKALAYYQGVFNICYELEMQPVVTLFHFVSPLWAHRVWTEGTDEFVQFCCAMVDKFAGDSRVAPIFVTLNEPYLYALHAYMVGARPPFIRDRKICVTVLSNMLADHVKVYRYIKMVAPQCTVTIAKNVMPVHPSAMGNVSDHLLAYEFNKFFNESYFDFINTGIIDLSLLGCSVKNDTGQWPVLDIFGCNHYTEVCMKTQLSLISPVTLLLQDPFGSTHDFMTAAGWVTSPFSWHNTLDMIKENVKLPILITECGVSQGQEGYKNTITQGDAMRHILKAISCHRQVIGVLVWTITENLEWEHSAINFGLFDTDRNPTPIYEPIKDFFKRV